MRKTAREIVEIIRNSEKEIIGTDILAPMISDSTIVINVGGYNHFLTVNEQFDSSAISIGLFRVQTIFDAMFIRSCTVHEQNKYLSMFHKTHIVVIDPENNVGIVFGSNKYTNYVSREKRAIFDIILCRNIGNSLVDCGYSNANNPNVSALMRKCLLDGEKDLPKASGVSVYHRTAYREVVVSNANTEFDTIKHALEYNGAGLIDFWSTENGVYVVRYTVSGREFLSEISQDNLQVISSGVCLSGEDMSFDLTSVVGVLRHGIETDQV